MCGLLTSRSQLARSGHRLGPKARVPHDRAWWSVLSSVMECEALYARFCEDAVAWTLGDEIEKVTYLVGGIEPFTYTR